MISLFSRATRVASRTGCSRDSSCSASGSPVSSSWHSSFCGAAEARNRMIGCCCAWVWRVSSASCSRSATGSARRAPDLFAVHRVPALRAGLCRHPRDRAGLHLASSSLSAMFAAAGVAAFLRRLRGSTATIVAVVLGVCVLAEAGMALFFVRVPTAADDGGICETCRRRGRRVLSSSCRSSRLHPACPGPTSSCRVYCKCCVMAARAVERLLRLPAQELRRHRR